MRKFATSWTVGLAGLVGLGLLSWPALTAVDSSAPAGTSGDAAYLKRDDHAADLVLVADDDDDDSDSASGSRNTGSSVSRTDGTRSNFTKVSRDRDRSRGDKTKDWTRDRTDQRTRDRSANRTNDRSRNDTRWRRN
jgi:hypothetical protein